MDPDDQEIEMTRDEFTRLMERMDRLELKNKTLKLEHELSMVYREVDHAPAEYGTSTPNAGNVRLDIPKGRGDDCSMSRQSSPGMEMGRKTDQFVTERRMKTDGSGGKKHDVMGDHGMKSQLTKPATYDGSTEWTNYKAHFEACARLNKWTEEQKGLYLSVSLRGQAQGVFGNLTSKSTDYKDLVKALEVRFAPPNQTELYRVQLRDRRQKPIESMSELGQDIRRLTNLAYPNAPYRCQGDLSKGAVRGISGQQ